MAEAEQEKTLSLAEQWLLQEKEEKQEPGETPTEASPSAVKVNQTPVEVSQTTEEVTQTPVEVSQTTEEVTQTPVEVSQTTEEVPTNAAAEEPVTDNVNDETPAVEENTEAPQPEQSEEEEVAEEKPEIKIETAPADFRFPTTNQTRHCFTRYVEYHRCIAAKGDGAPECDKFAKYYRSLCPGEWVDRWNEQRENGTFPGPL
ncbi:cytochrome c oxidase subunit 6b-1-like [Aristolochia californica]|uniref:cytochrome c oxidase subunit 6b-1-like n=1 Tax=Aristolochia californica TaxID=171875 RepID=UPI0035E1B5A2